MKTISHSVVYIPQHKDGYFIDVFRQPHEDFTKAVKFFYQEDLEKFLLGRHGPDDPQNFRVAKIKITYELEAAEDDGRD